MKKVIFGSPQNFIKVTDLDIEKGVVGFLRDDYNGKDIGGKTGFLMKAPEGGFGFYLPCGTGRSIVNHETIWELIEHMTMRGWEFYQLK